MEGVRGQGIVDLLPLRGDEKKSRDGELVLHGPLTRERAVS